jgi:hypothetical protein
MALDINPWSRSIRLGAGPAGVWFIDRARRYHYEVCETDRRAYTMASGCAYCGGEATTLDHVQPIARGGKNDARNLWPCCQPCNVAKGSTPLLVWLADEADRRHRRTLIAHNQRHRKEATTSMAAKLREALGRV